MEPSMAGLSRKMKRAPSRASTDSMSEERMEFAVSGNSRSAVINEPRSANASKVSSNRRKLLFRELTYHGSTTRQSKLRRSRAHLFRCNVAGYELGAHNC